MQEESRRGESSSHQNAPSGRRSEKSSGAQKGDLMPLNQWTFTTMSWMTKNGHSSEWLFSLGHSSRCVSTIFLLLLCHLFGCWAGLNCRKAPEIFFITSNHPRKCVYSTLYSIVTYKVKVSLMGLMYQIFVFYSLFICFQWKINYFSQDST